MKDDKRMEDNIHDTLMAPPALIESGLTFKKHEVVMGPEARCDLHFIDSLGRDLYVEVKQEAGDQAVGQILKYRVAKGPSSSARYMVAPPVFERYTIEILESLGIEHCLLQEDNVEEVLVKTLIEELKNKNIAKAAEMFGAI